MKLVRFLSLAFLLGAAASNPSQAAGDDDTLILKGPDGVDFAFRRVRISNDTDPLAGRQFTMGGDGTNFRIPPTRVVIGGSFVDEKGRYYYMGATEVTNRQFRAVTGKETAGGDDYPVTNVSWLDAQIFLDALNRYLYEHELKSMPHLESFPAYARLPTEFEWEFAARGGAAVDKTVFDGDTPYDEEDDELAEFEWFSGPKSSHGKLQKVGKLKPNPLGLYDMLGNVTEMTSGLYQVEYYQGRSGGFVARGSHYLSPEDQLSSAKRSEEPLYLNKGDKGMQPNASPTMGFRLALGTPVLTDKKQISAIENSWKEHRSGRGKDWPAGTSVSDVNSQVGVHEREALERLKRLEDELSQVKEDNEKLKQEKKDGKERAALLKELKNTQTALIKMNELREKADRESAGVWVKMACERGMYLAENLQKLDITKNAPQETLRKKAEQFAYNVNRGLENYSEIMTEMAKLPKDFVMQGFNLHTAQIRQLLEKEKKSTGATKDVIVKDLAKQIERISVTKSHYEKFLKTQRADRGTWQRDYLEQKGAN